jgi:hypothetical protein
MKIKSSEGKTQYVRKCRERLKQFVIIVDHDRIKNVPMIKYSGRLVNEDQISEGRSALQKYGSMETLRI